MVNIRNLHYVRRRTSVYSHSSRPSGSSPHQARVSSLQYPCRKVNVGSHHSRRTSHRPVTTFFLVLERPDTFPFDLGPGGTDDPSLSLTSFPFSGSLLKVEDRRESRPTGDSVCTSHI